MNTLSNPLVKPSDRWVTVTWRNFCYRPQRPDDDILDLGWSAKSVHPERFHLIITAQTRRRAETGS